MAITRGVEIHVQFKRSEEFQGLTAPPSVSTLLPFQLADQPQSAQALKLLVGTVGLGRGRLAYLGLDYSVDVVARKITWLATAQFPLVTSNILYVSYFTAGMTA